MKHLTWSSTIDFSRPCYLGNKCMDNNCILIGLNCVCCKKCSIPIGKKCSISIDFVIRDNYYCCHDCYIGEQMTGDGFPYKFVTFHENEEYFCFLRVEDTIKEMIDDFLQIILGSKYSSSQDYGAQIMFSGKILTQELRIKNLFQTKKDNNVWFNMPKQILTRSKKGTNQIFKVNPLSLLNQLQIIMIGLKYLMIINNLPILILENNFGAILMKYPKKLLLHLFSMFINIYVIFHLLLNY